MLSRVDVDVLLLVAFNGKRKVSWEAALAPVMKNENVLQERYRDTLLSTSRNEIQKEQASIEWTWSCPPRGPDDVLYRPERSNADANKIPKPFFDA